MSSNQNLKFNNVEELASIPSINKIFFATTVIYKNTSEVLIIAFIIK